MASKDIDVADAIGGLFCIAALALLMWLVMSSAVAAPLAVCQKYRPILTREAHFVQGLNAPIPMFAAQIEQESSCRAGITSFDGGKGLAQFTGGTIDGIGRLYPDLGPSQPYNPVWAIRALVRYDTWLHARVRGVDDCQRYAAALKGYNAGLGYSQQAQRLSRAPDIWFGMTEYVPTRQTPANFEASRMYPRKVLLQRQPNYRGWGKYLCEGVRA